MTTLSLRDATPADVPALQAIYAHHVRNGVATFELTPPDIEEMARRVQTVRAQGLPYIVAERAEPDGARRIVGYAYAAPFRARPAYRFTVEDSIYIAAGEEGKGLGRILLTELIARCTALGFRQMVAVIGADGPSASVGLHAALGFAHAGKLPALGWKFERWLDIVMMQLPLGDGADAPPQELTLPIGAPPG